MYEESNIYCFDLEQQDAEEECSLFGECNPATSYFPGLSCETTLECQQILCKSTCEYDFRGKCLAGEIPDQEAIDWCSSGCCRFDTTTKFCDYQPTKWNCEVLAQNKDVETFTFQKMTQAECEQSCQEPITEPAVVETVSEKEELPAEVIPEPTKEPGVNITTEPEKKDPILVATNPHVPANTPLKLASQGLPSCSSVHPR